MDSASTANYITTKAAKDLALPHDYQDVVTIKLNQSVKEKVPMSKFHLKIPEETEIDCTIVDRIIPQVSSEHYQKAQEFVKGHMKDVEFSPIDEEYLDVDVLIGIDHLPKIYTEDLKLVDSLVVHKTKLGYYQLLQE